MLFRTLQKWRPWGSLHPHHVTIATCEVNSFLQKVSNLLKKMKLSMSRA